MAENKTKPTGEKAVMCGSMVGFGQMHYKYASGHEGDCFKKGFDSRRPDLVLYIRRLADVDGGVLEKLIAACARDMKRAALPCS